MYVGSTHLGAVPLQPGCAAYNPRRGSPGYAVGLSAANLGEDTHTQKDRVYAVAGVY